MRWLELRFPLADIDPDALEAQLEALGALSITLQDGADEPLLEPAPGEHPVWRESRVRALFAAQTNTPALCAALWRGLHVTSPPPVQVVIVKDQQWERVWRQELAPLRFGRRLWVCPSESAPPEPAAVNLTLDPGLAFGSGTHPSTALCLDWLDQAAVEGKSVVDYGCGSGILAIAAARLGAQHVWAVDHDPQALSATRANARRNAVSARIATVEPDVFAAHGVAIVLANILARPLIELAARFAEIVAPRGELVLAGILESQQETLIAAYSRWFALERWAMRDGWACLHGSRLASAP